MKVEYTAKTATMMLATMTGVACSRIPYVIQHAAAPACTQRILTGWRTKYEAANIPVANHPIQLDTDTFRPRDRPGSRH